MVYMGSKSKVAKKIIPIINNYIKENKITNFYDVFCGGGNICDKIVCDNVYASDLSPTLIALHQQAQLDFSKIPEDYGTRENWDLAYSNWKNFKAAGFLHPERLDMPLYKIGAIEWYSSYSGGGFPRGFANPSGNRDYYIERRKNHFNQANTELYKKINFSCCDYSKVNFKDNSLIYLDPPYKDTKSYGISPHFDYNAFYTWLKRISTQFPVFVSEQFLPEEFKSDIINRDKINRTIGDNHNFISNEILWLIDNRNGQA